jgi:hypothetical protein
LPKRMWRAAISSRLMAFSLAWKARMSSRRSRQRLSWETLGHLKSKSQQLLSA